MFNIVGQVKDYFSAKAQLYQLKAIEQIAGFYARHLSFLVVWTFFAFFLLFASIAAAIAIGEMYERMYMGFVWITGFYLLCVIILVLFRKALLQRPFMDRTINAIFKYDSQATDQEL